MDNYCSSMLNKMILYHTEHNNGNEKAYFRYKHTADSQDKKWIEGFLVSSSDSTDSLAIEGKVIYVSKMIRYEQSREQLNKS